MIALHLDSQDARLLLVLTTEPQSMREVLAHLDVPRRDHLQWNTVAGRLFRKRLAVRVSPNQYLLSFEGQTEQARLQLLVKPAREVEPEIDLDPTPRCRLSAPALSAYRVVRQLKQRTARQLAAQAGYSYPLAERLWAELAQAGVL